MQDLHIETERDQSAIGAHLGPDARRQVAVDVIVMAYGKRRHQLFDTALAQGAFDLGVVAHDKPVKFVAALFTVIFIDGHFSPPYFRGFVSKRHLRF